MKAKILELCMVIILIISSLILSLYGARLNSIGQTASANIENQQKDINSDNSNKNQEGRTQSGNSSKTQKNNTESNISDDNLEASKQSDDKSNPVVVLDAGHGAVDSGKVGINGVLEKDINLKIVLKLKTILEKSGIEVILTRIDDTGLYSEKDSNKKLADMKARCKIIDESKADIAVSIHQNSYHESYVTGAQVFYYTHSDKGKLLAEKIQAHFTDILGEKNKRQAKSNSDYYLLLHVSCPIVIVECGFLSNWEEATNLSDDAYQENIAKSIAAAIIEYLNL